MSRPPQTLARSHAMQNFRKDLLNGTALPASSAGLQIIGNDRHLQSRHLPFIASESLPAIALAASRAASATTCPYLAVIWALLWPNSLPITGSPRLPFTPQDAKLWRRSWIRRSANPAAVRIRSQV